jgi:hypothetical protein
MDFLNSMANCIGESTEASADVKSNESQIQPYLFIAKRFREPLFFEALAMSHATYIEPAFSVP